VATYFKWKQSINGRVFRLSQLVNIVLLLELWKLCRCNGNGQMLAIKNILSSSKNIGSDEFDASGEFCGHTELIGG